MESARVHLYQFASGGHWAPGDSVEAYLRQLMEIDMGLTPRADRIAALTVFLDEAFQLAHSIGWTGAVREAPQMFALPGLPADEQIYMVAWEQEDGIAFAAAPYPLPWLEAKATRFTDSTRAVPAREERAPGPFEPAPRAPAPREEEADPFAEFARRGEEAARLAREAAEEDRPASGRRFF
ncbi:hypothetical protein [Azorhizobium]|jgi:hypothetical protein|uniref:Uncharacterized protein n=1 Tax=Azorhizobium caulinodans (strain ATCC 43989 / DSM 5975 / JCM 20966 / LMG 6465 / NBRC 14845 / NCIMB 13405 / ORS 571) TaxID=438753 RepID=A8II69_AZOC5|nr:hypothetical protein [Azorhizobium]TDT93824.1 hypothetical protein DFO45_3208 [Azorhizobium sp. AG788]BAF89367.1 hypothetical protein AZC_3369 [Azorhizobium caulinodans ORS 571]